MVLVKPHLMLNSELEVRFLFSSEMVNNKKIFIHSK
jgi:hypothetical protein